MLKHVVFFFNRPFSLFNPRGIRLTINFKIFILSYAKALIMYYAQYYSFNPKQAEAQNIAWRIGRLLKINTMQRSCTEINLHHIDVNNNISNNNNQTTTVSMFPSF